MANSNVYDLTDDSHGRMMDTTRPLPRYEPLERRPRGVVLPPLHRLLQRLPQRHAVHRPRAARALAAVGVLRCRRQLLIRRLDPLEAVRAAPRPSCIRSMNVCPGSYSMLPFSLLY